MFLNASLLTTALSAQGAADIPEPPVAVVVATGLILVFAILVLLYVILLVEGKIFQSLDKRKAEKQKAQSSQNQSPNVQASPSKPSAAAGQPPPAIEAGIPSEVVAAISAAVASIEGGRYTLRSVSATQKGRGQWGLAGVVADTEPF